MEDHQRAKEASPQESDQRLAQPWPEPGSNETGEQRADQYSYPKARPEQAVSLDSSMQDLVAVDTSHCAFEEMERKRSPFNNNIVRALSAAALLLRLRPDQIG